MLSPPTNQNPTPARVLVTLNSADTAQSFQDPHLMRDLGFQYSATAAKKIGSVNVVVEQRLGQLGITLLPNV
jgi:hypothetical protein